MSKNMELIEMLALCGEKECRNVKGYPEKLRALIDGLIKLRRENVELRRENVELCEVIKRLNNENDDLSAELITTREMMEN